MKQIWICNCGFSSYDILGVAWHRLDNHKEEYDILGMKSGWDHWDEREFIL